MEEELVLDIVQNIHDTTVVFASFVSALSVVSALTYRINNVCIFNVIPFMFVCACPSVISSIFGKSFRFSFPYFVIFVLRYFPFHLARINLAMLEKFAIDYGLKAT